MKHKDFATLRTFYTMNEALVVKSLLDSMGINNQIISSATPIMPYVMVKVDPYAVVVNASDYERANELLEAEFEKSDIGVESAE